MQQRYHLSTLSKGVQVDTTNFFVVWWVLFECSSFDHFPNIFFFVKSSKFYLSNFEKSA